MLTLPLTLTPTLTLFLTLTLTPTLTLFLTLTLTHYIYILDILLYSGNPNLHAAFRDWAPCVVGQVAAITRVVPVSE